MEHTKENVDQQHDDVQVMTREERDSFRGLTIEQSGRREESADWQTGAGRDGIYIRHYSWNSVGWMTKLAIAVVLVAVVSGAVFIGGGLLLLFVLGWLVSRIFRR